MRKLQVFMLGIATLALAGCLNYEQETSLNEDLSGTAVIDIFTNPQSLRAGIKEAGARTAKSGDFLSKIGGTMAGMAAKEDVNFNVDIALHEDKFLDELNTGAIKNKKYEHFTKDGVSHNRFSVEFSNIKNIYKERDRVRISEDGRGNVLYVEHIALSVLTPKEPSSQKKDDFFNNLDNPELYKGCYVKYTLRMPRDILSANTARMCGNTAIWIVPLGQFIKDKGFTATVTLKPQSLLKKLQNRFSGKGAL